MAKLSGTGGAEFDHLLKLLLIGSSGVGKSCLLLRFTTDTFDDLSPTIGVDFKLKSMTVGGKRVKLTIWDTVYDVTNRESFADLQEVWMKEVDQYSTNSDCVIMLIGNKVDLKIVETPSLMKSPAPAGAVLRPAATDDTEPAAGCSC